MVRLVPPPNLYELETMGEEGRVSLRADLERRVRASGVAELQELVPHPAEPAAGFAVFREGMPPCHMEREQTDSDDRSALWEASRASRLLESRVEMLNLSP